MRIWIPLMTSDMEHLFTHFLVTGGLTWHSSSGFSAFPVSLSHSSFLVKGLAAQLCLTLCDPVDCSPPGSSVHGMLWARILEWVAMPSSRGSSRPRDQTHISCIGKQILYTESPGKPIPKSVRSRIIRKHSIVFSSLGNKVVPEMLEKLYDYNNHNQ